MSVFLVRVLTVALGWTLQLGIMDTGTVPLWAQQEGRSPDGIKMLLSVSSLAGGQFGLYLPWGVVSIHHPLPCLLGHLPSPHGHHLPRG